MSFESRPGRHRVAGERVSQIQQATDHADLMSKLAEATWSASSRGFQTHVHSRGRDGKVLADGFYPAAVNMPVSEWMAATNNVDTTDLVTTGGYTWLGPISSAKVSPGASPQPLYILYVPVPIEDRLTSTTGDGIGETLELLVIVSAHNSQYPDMSEGGGGGGACSVLCKGFDEYDAAKSASCDTLAAGSRVCAGLEWSDWTTTSHTCTEPFADETGFDNQNSGSGLMVWADDQGLNRMCGCKAGYEAVLVPVGNGGRLTDPAIVPYSTWTHGAAETDYGLGQPTCATSCTGSAESCAALVDMHTPYVFACAQSFAPTNVVLIIIVVLVVLGCPAALFFYYYRRRMKRQLSGLKQQLEDFKDSVVGVRTVQTDWDPRMDDDFNSAFNRAMHDELSSMGDLERGIPYGSNVGETEAAAPAEAEAPLIEHAKWYWQENSHNIDKHNPKDVIADGFVSYSGSVSQELTLAHHAWQQGTGPVEIVVDLADRIASTGTEAKADDPKNSGVVFKVSFERMEQFNAKTGFGRKIQRVPLPPEQQPKPARKTSSTRTEGSRSSASAPKAGVGGRKASADGGKSDKKPDEICGEDSLILHKGQMVQTSKQRPDGWVFGSVIFDPMDSRPPMAVEGVSTQAGWFPLDRTDLPKPHELEQMQKQMGGEGAADALKPPPAWQAVKDPMAVELFKVDGKEEETVRQAFMKSLGPYITVVGVQRIQNMSMWQSYAVKRQTVIAREIAYEQE